MITLLLAVSITAGYVVRTGIPLGWNYGVWYGITSSLENVKKYCAGVDVNQDFPMTKNTYTRVKSCKILLKRIEEE